MGAAKIRHEDSIDSSQAAIDKYGHVRRSGGEHAMNGAAEHGLAENRIVVTHQHEVGLAMGGGGGDVGGDIVADEGDGLDRQRPGLGLREQWDQRRLRLGFFFRRMQRFVLGGAA